MMIHTAIEVLTQVPPAIPDPGGPVAPPGSNGVMTIMRWVMWVVFALCFLGTAAIAGKMALEHNSPHGGGMAVTNLWKPLTGAIVATNITGILAGVATFA
ncbi:hypothetical protein REH65_33060 (plasmid) [Saccharopolyspora sp. ID03-671]|uniref:hypothetical protein n=1 Tax=Saccharopolyspora sp. ID03-671 TaxID=3073066 RepID=UPI0030F4327D